MKYNVYQNSLKIFKQYYIYIHVYMQIYKKKTILKEIQKEKILINNIKLLNIEHKIIMKSTNSETLT